MNKFLKFIKNNMTLFVVCLIIVILLIEFLFFNTKINKMYHNINKNSSDNSEALGCSFDCNFEFIDFIKVNPHYDPTKEWYEYSQDTHVKVYNSAQLDENGIALANGKYNAVTISQYGLNAYGRYITEKNEEYLEVAIKQADFLLEMQDKETGNYYYDYDYAVYGSDEVLKAPWNSAMAVGNTLSLLTRIYYVTNDEKYLDAAINSLKPLTLDVEDGGLVSYLFGHKFYEEYPTNKGNFALNGFMFTLIGLYDFYTVTGNQLAGRLYNDGIDTLTFALPFYDSVGISLYHLSHLFYDNQPIHYSDKYHVIHIGQLELLYQLEKEEIFKYYIDRWTSYVLTGEEK